ncbi:cytochrome c oxidase subunit 3 [Georgenia sp. Z1344]|uniref:aa3-type cytochrome oxidase subunit III n=1 Tax=Georgenia sp. Z1344 TaxID=3416706 RepID=UPI003CF1EE0B
MSSTSAPAHVPGTVNRPNPLSVGVIVWLSSELMFFAGLFAMYFTHRSVAGPEAWSDEASVLNFPWALSITIILVASSFTCQMGVWAAERFQQSRTGSMLDIRRWGMNEWYVLSFVLGAIFVAGQTTEYIELMHHGVTIQASSYSSVFYITTGFHALHVIGGLIAFLYVLGRSYQAKVFGHLEAGSAVVVSYYWHFVDVVWIGLFIIIYVIR